MPGWDDVAPLNRLVTMPDGVPALTLGWEALAFAAEYLTHTNGVRYGMPWMFTDEQARFVLWWYSLDEDGKWLFRHGIRRLAKGSGKSPFAATMALIEFCGPVRLDNFDPRLPGGCKGKRVSMPLVQIAATAESQTEFTMRHIRGMAPKGGRLATEFALDPGRTRYNMLPEGSLSVITSTAATAEGAEATFVIADETEHWTPSKGGPALHRTLSDNLAKSGSRMLETANAWRPGVGSVAESGWAAWVEQEEGRARVDKGRILYDARIAPPDTDLADPDSLRKALEFVYEDCSWVNIDSIMGRIWDTSSSPDDSKRKYLNWPTVSANSWVTPEDWARLARPDIKVQPGERIAMFFDGSKSRDATALIGCRMSDGHVFTIGVWEPAPVAHGEETAHIDAEEVDDKVNWAFDTYDVVAFFADVKEWEGFVKVTWPKRHGDDLKIKAVPQGRNVETIAWDMRSHLYDFALAVELTEAEIQQQAFTHDGNSALARHVANCRRHETRFGSITVKKETPNSRNKIDAAVCMIGARMAYKRALDGVKDTPVKRNRAAFI